MTRRRRGLRFVAITLVALLAGGLVTFTQSVLTSPTSAVAADLRGFDPERIIDDSVFYNSSAMSATEIQSFLDQKIGSCTNGKCLNVLTTGISTRGAVYSQTTGNLICAAIQGGTMRVSELIYRVQVSCGISAKVILVTLQKEQGLTTSKAPSDWNLTAAMGASCPDTAPCDPAFAGVGPQILKGAQQLKTYKAANFAKQPGPSYIGYSPTAACGGTTLNIRNYATAALYNYTPYQPNAAALAAGYGLGDSCSSYGNRNFFNYFTDWFGSTRGYDVPDYFAASYASNQAWLGYPVDAVTCSNPGCVQQFQGGILARSTAGIFAVAADYSSAWRNYGREFGPIGVPVSNRICSDMQNACRQEFTGGWLVSNGDIGVRFVSADVRTIWGYWGREYGPLGLPLTDAQCESNGVCTQVFQGGWVVRAAAIGIRVVPNASLTTWSNWGREYNILGLPTTDPTPANWTDFRQQFQGGVITVTGGQGRLTSATDPWVGTALANPWLGAAQSSAPSCTLGAGGCYRAYDGGWIVQSKSGTFAITREVLRVWSDWGREYNILGYPTGPASADPTTGNYTQQFQGGVITVTGGQGRLTSATDPWVGTALANPWLGAAQSSAPSCTLGAGGCYRAYDGGWIVQSKSGTFAITREVLRVWSDWGREYNILGYPTGPASADPTTGNYTQQFQGGVITVTGGQGRLTSATDPWVGTALANPWLGAAQSSAPSCTLGAGGCYRAYDGGWIVQSKSGTFAITREVLRVWSDWGREYNILGYPTGPASADPTTGNYTQQFQGGVITVTGGQGTRG
ncbi:LGFP repeat-containing protein [Microbacterium aurum]